MYFQCQESVRAMYCSLRRNCIVKACTGGHMPWQLAAKPGIRVCRSVLRGVGRRRRPSATSAGNTQGVLRAHLPDFRRARGGVCVLGTALRSAQHVAYETVGKLISTDDANILDFDVSTGGGATKAPTTALPA